MIYGAWSILCSVDVLVGKYGSDQIKAAWDAAWKLPKFGWKVWLIGMLFITVLMIFEGSYQHSRSLEERLSSKLRIPEVSHEQLVNNGGMTHYFDVVNDSEGCHSSKHRTPTILMTWHQAGLATFRVRFLA